MIVSLFRDLVSEQWASIEVYADRVGSGLRHLNIAGWSFVDRCPTGVRWSRPRTTMLYLNRALIYPAYALVHQGDINHVLDNSYGHLLHFMDSRRTVVTSHGGTPISWRKWNREGPAMRFFDWTFSGTLKSARLIIVSEYAKRELLKDYRYDPAHIHVVHHGVQESFRRLLDDQSAQTRERLLRPGEAGLILHVGHCATRKNVDGLLNIFAVLLKQTARPYRLLQIGGQFTPEQNSIIDEHNLREHITQIAAVPNDRLVDYYNAADVFAYPSLYEGFGVPLVEAMACGTPVVCSDHELFHEVCADSALYANSRDAGTFASALLRVLADTGIAAEMRQRGLRRAQDFTWERCARETFAVYQALIDERK